jgi:hypothetical protein
MVSAASTGQRGHYVNVFIMPVGDRRVKISRAQTLKVSENL